MIGVQNGPGRLRVAAVQFESKYGSVQANHSHAAPLIEQAAGQGAELIVLPELFASGYIPNQNIWDMAEPENGPTIQWMRVLSKSLGVYLGAGLVETDGYDFYNVYAITDPNGDVSGKVRKLHAETYCFRSGEGHLIADSAIGRIGAGICADNHMTEFLKRMQASSVDIMLMPHAWPAPMKTSRVVSEGDIRKAEDDMRELAIIYARYLGVPVIFVNPVGRMARMMGILGSLMPPDVFGLRGMSRIVDSDGSLKGELGDSEGILVADVVLDPSRKLNTEPRGYSGWLHTGSTVVRKVIIPSDRVLARLWYGMNGRRRKKTREIAGR